MRASGLELPAGDSLPSTSSRLTTVVGPAGRAPAARVRRPLPRAPRDGRLAPASTQRATEPRDGGARQVCGLGPDRGYRRRARRAQPSPARSECVSRGRGGRCSRRADLERRAVEQADARAVEDEEDLLLRGLPMERRRPAAGVDPDPVHADGLRAGSRAEIGPLARDVAGFRAAALDLVPVGDHMSIMSRAAPCRGARPPPPVARRAPARGLPASASRRSPRSSASSSPGAAPLRSSCRSGRAGRARVFRPCRRR